MSYDSGLSEPPRGYEPAAGRHRRARPRRSRPLSDSDIWAAYLPGLPPFAYRSITDHSCLKVYNKDPAQAFSHGPRPANGDARVSTPAPVRTPSLTAANGDSCHSRILFAGRIPHPLHLLIYVAGGLILSSQPPLLALAASSTCKKGTN